MPRISVIAKNYAKTLFLVAKKNNEIGIVSNELNIFKENFSSNFAYELKNPVISKTDLVKIINEVTKKFKLGNLTSNFFASVVKNRRLNLFPEIHAEFIRMSNEYQNILEIEVITSTISVDLSNVKKHLEKINPNKKIIIKHIITPKILGGVQIKIGSNLIDASLKNQIEQIKKECLTAIN